MMSGRSHFKYAEALLNVAESKKLAEKVLSELEELAHLCRDAHFQQLLKKVNFSPRETAEKILDSVFEGKVEGLLLNLLKILAAEKKLNLLPKICEAYRRLYHERNGIDEVLIRSARKLSPDEEKKLVEQLKQKKAKAVSVRFEQNPELIGGLQLYEKGYLYDQSLQHYLKGLEKFLLQKEIS
jgi:F-type H+-transporting ATPase subunit delta